MRWAILLTVRLSRIAGYTTIDIINAFIASLKEIPSVNTQEILEKQKKYLWPNHLLYYTEPMPLDHGDGLYVWDTDNNKYLDFFAGILTTSVGHNHPKVTERVREQVGVRSIHQSGHDVVADAHPTQFEFAFPMVANAKLRFVGRA